MAASMTRRSGSKAVAGVASESARTSMTRSPAGRARRDWRADWRGKIHGGGVAGGGEVRARGLAGQIHEGAIAGASGHPGGSVEDDDVIVAGLQRSAEAELGDREQEQRHGNELQSEERR